MRALLRRCLSAAQYLAENIAQRVVATLRRLARLLATTLEDLIKDIAKRIVAALWRGRRLSLPHHLLDYLAERIGCAKSASSHLLVGLLRKPAHQHRGESRQHLLENVLAHAAGLTRLCRDGAGKILGAKKLTQNTVAGIDALQVLSCCYHREQGTQALWGRGCLLQPLAECWKQCFDRRLSLLRRKAKLFAQ